LQPKKRVSVLASSIFRDKIFAREDIGGFVGGE
jgi:hypothetical protein